MLNFCRKKQCVVIISRKTAKKLIRQADRKKIINTLYFCRKTALIYRPIIKTAKLTSIFVEILLGLIVLIKKNKSKKVKN
jgi:hypothetical protein